MARTWASFGWDAADAPVDPFERVMLKLVLFDVDGTLVDGQAHIVASMAQAFVSLRLPPPTREET